jgi:hypothetical protein
MFPFDAVSIYEGEIMGRRAEVALYRMYATEKSHRYVRIVKSGRGWAPKIQHVGEPGSYYLRYLKNGRRTFESVGDDIQVALQEQRAREKGLSAPQPVAIIGPRKTVRDAVSDFLKGKPEATRFILGVFGDFYGWDEDPVNFQRVDFKAYAAHVAKLGKRPRTQKNYLNHLTTFLRSMGRVVLVARNEQDATVRKATAVIPNTLVLTRSDFPKINRGIKDFYSQAQVDALFAACKSLRERLMLSLFYFHGVPRGRGRSSLLDRCPMGGKGTFGEGEAATRMDDQNLYGSSGGNPRPAVGSSAGSL